MIDPRVTAWHHLFPSGSKFTAMSGPEPFRKAVEVLGKGSRQQVLVSWGDSSQNLPDLAPYAGLVSVNGRGITARQLRERGFPHVRRFAVLPHLGDARWLIPLGTPAATEGALRVNTPFRFIPRLKHAGARLAARSGVSSVFRNQLTIAQRQVPPLDETLTLVLGTHSFELAVLTGAPARSRNSRPTIAVLDVRGNWLAFAKLASSATPRNQISHEAHCLRYLAGEPALASFVPELLIATELDDAFVTVQRALAGTTPGTALTPAHGHILESLSNGPETLATDTHLIRSLREQIRRETITGLNLGRVHELIHLALQGVAVPRTIVHGDFAPWNMRLRANVLQVFDWEYGELDGLPLVDEIFYRLQVGLLLEGWTEDQAFERLLTFQSIQSRRPFEPSMVRALQIVGLLKTLLRISEAGGPLDMAAFMVQVRLIQRLVRKLEEELQ